METNETFRIADALVPILMGRLAKINKKASKLGSLPVEVREVGSETEETADGPVLFRLFEINGSAPQFDGWSFLGTLDHTVESGVIIRSMPGESAPEKYRDADPVCDHCQKIRRRKATFIVKHDLKGTKQIGRTCLRDYLGGNDDPMKVARLLEYVYEIQALLSSATGWEVVEGKGDPSKFLLDYLTATAAVIEEYGWVSRGKAYDDPSLHATASLVNKLMFIPYASLRPAGQELLGKMNDSHEARAEAAIEWARGLRDKPGINDYEHNVAVVAEGGIVTHKLSGIAASIIPSHDLAMEHERIDNIKDSLRANSVGLGALGEKVEVTVNILGVREIETRFGASFLVKMVTAEGNACAWFAKKKPCLEAGKTYRLRGGVKKVAEYKGITETTLSRCSVVS